MGTLFALGTWEAPADGVRLGESARCLATVLLTSLPPSLLMFTMLRRGSLLHGNALTLTASLAVAAMSAAAMTLFHRLDASAMVLVWNLGVAVLIVVAGSPLGRRWASGP
ncbi:MAG TPA: NrsF family protein [Ideonella sp.]|jgi:hypothetical protein|nr:NrsF family protein [Ideonella sp.]